MNIRVHDDTIGATTTGNTQASDDSNIIFFCDKKRVSLAELAVQSQLVFYHRT